MTFKIRRSSTLPIYLEDDEVHTMQALEHQNRWIELEDYVLQLKANDDMKEIFIDVVSIGDLEFTLSMLEPNSKFLIDFKAREIVILDNGMTE